MWTLDQTKITYRKMQRKYFYLLNKYLSNAELMGKLHCFYQHFLSRASVALVQCTEGLAVVQVS